MTYCRPMSMTWQIITAVLFLLHISTTLSLKIQLKVLESKAVRLPIAWVCLSLLANCAWTEPNLTIQTGLVTVWTAIDFLSLSFRPNSFIYYWWLLSLYLSLDISDFIFIACSSWGFMGWQKHCGFFPESSVIWFWVGVVWVELLKTFVEDWFPISSGDELVWSWCVPVCVWNHQVPQLELMLISCCDKNTTGQTLNTAQLSLHFIFNFLASILTV